MILEIENELHKRIHETVGQSAVVIRLAESLDESGRITERTMITIAWTGAENSTQDEGAYVPKIWRRDLTFRINIVQTELQREGHSFALPLIDLIWDAVSGWVPPVKGIEFFSGFRPGPSRFVAVTETKQFIYEQLFTLSVIISDGRSFSTPCAAFDDIKLDAYLPQRKCLSTAEGRNTGLAVWRRRISDNEIEEFVVEDPRCEKAIVDPGLILTCRPGEDGIADYRFEDFNEVITSGTLRSVWKCLSSNGSQYPKWFNLNVNTSIWRNVPGTVPNTLPDFSARQDILRPLNNIYFEK